MAIQTLDPFLIDLNLISSSDFQKRLTDYVSILTAFPDETALNSLYWHTDSHSDPITSKIEFYKQLNEGKIILKNNPDGVLKRSSSASDLRNKNIRDQLEDTLHLSTPSGGKYGEPQISGTETNVVEKTYDKQWTPVKDGVTHVNSNAEWKVTSTTSDDRSHAITPPTEDQYVEIELSSEFGMKDMSAWFISWWLEKFRTAHHMIKQDLIEILGDDNEYFVDFSESVGQLKNLDMFEDTSTLPVYDVKVNAIEKDKHSIPATAPSVALYCVSEDSKQLIKDMSKNTNIVFRRNLKQMIEDPSRDTSISNILVPLDHNTTSHGQNFVSDYLHNTRMVKFTETVHSVIQKHLKGLYKVLELISNRENLMVQNKPGQITMKVEEYTHAVDLLKNKIRKYEATSQEKIQSKFGKSTRVQQTYTNDQVLSTNNNNT